MPEIISKNLTLSTADLTALPIRAFDVLILVEPDPEGWMPHPQDEEAFEEVVLFYNDLITHELEGWEGHEVPESPLPIVETRVIWTGIDEGEVYGMVAEHWATAKFRYFNVDGELFAELAYYLQGLYLAHPKFRVAVVGATIENEVMEVGNLVAGFGFETTILTRYCFSQDAFVNLDDFYAQLNARRRTMREMGYTDEEIWGLE